MEQQPPIGLTDWSHFNFGHVTKGQM
jgi:hypothetical protein